MEINIIMGQTDKGKKNERRRMNDKVESERKPKKRVSHISLSLSFVMPSLSLSLSLSLSRQERG